MIRHPGAAAVVPVLSDPDGPDPTILLIRQFRYAAGGPLWEIPAGRLADPGEDPADCARRELLEEAGVTASRVERLTTVWTTPGFTDEVIHIYQATALKKGLQRLDRDEVLDVVELSLKEAIERIEDGSIKDAKTIVGLQAVFIRAMKQ